MEVFKILKKTVNNVVVLTLKGKLDATTKYALNEKIQSLYNKKQFNIILNCKKLEFMDSSGIGAIMQGHKLLDPVGGKLKITSLPTVTKKVLKTMKLDTVWEIFDNLETAINSFK